MKNIPLPALWLIVLIVGLPQLSETVYTPSLPDIRYALKTSESMVEYTLTIYLFGFAVGTLFWGRLSDKFGRKPCVIGGFFVFILGCLGCCLAGSIDVLMFSRFMQAFGGSVGSVLGQAICRDAFRGPALGKTYSSVGSALAIFPAIGPVIGGFIAEGYGWQNIFLFLGIFTILLIVIVSIRLAETHPAGSREPVSLGSVAYRLLKDPRVIGFGLIIAASNGLIFSYFAEGSFYLITMLGLSPSAYGMSFIALAVSAMAGGITSRKLSDQKSAATIMTYGITIVAVFSSLFVGLALVHTQILPLPPLWMIGITISALMCMKFGICMIISNALALALVDYKHCIGTASSLFGFFYYCLISLFTFGIGSLHNATLWMMPLYFFGISLFMILVRTRMINNKVSVA